MPGFVAEVVAEGLIYGRDEAARFVLGACQTISLKSALQWLRAQAYRIADGLDPDPDRSGWVQPIMRCPSVIVPDCPAELRFWCEDPEEQQTAWDLLSIGEPFVLAVPDESGWYTLAIWPASVLLRPTGPVAGAAGQSRPSVGRHRKPRRTLIRIPGWIRHKGD
ncbi:hypothetical protein ACZ90_00440 [Streptomyces albus subsp. albus]|nr:hypothetical protein ACZ90_00440 [Streptomyces albus subsp. albus]